MRLARNRNRNTLQFQQLVSVIRVSRGTGSPESFVIRQSDLVHNGQYLCGAIRERNLI